MLKSLKKHIVLYLIFACIHAISTLASPIKIQTQKEFEPLMQSYYLSDDKPALRAALVDFLSENGPFIENKPTLQMPLIVYFSCIADQDKQAKKEFKKQLKNLNPPFKGYLENALSKPPEKHLKKVPASVTKNDMLWACYFASGDTTYLVQILDMVPNIKNRQNIDLFATGFTAEWSLALNAKIEPSVRVFLEEKSKNGTHDQKENAEKLLTANPTSLQKEAEQVLTQWNKSPGVMKP